MARDCQNHREYVVWSARGRFLGGGGSRELQLQVEPAKGDGCWPGRVSVPKCMQFCSQECRSRDLDGQGVLGLQGVRGLESQGACLGGQWSYSYRYMGRVDPVPYI
jgi:hypothetical protein